MGIDVLQFLMNTLKNQLSKSGTKRRLTKKKKSDEILFNDEIIFRIPQTDFMPNNLNTKNTNIRFTEKTSG